MPKMKTNSAAKKRFKKVGNGKIKHGSPFRRHLFASKTTKRKRHLRKAGYICEVDVHKIEGLMPY